jgi:hypothetical protein
MQPPRSVNLIPLLKPLNLLGQPVQPTTAVRFIREPLDASVRKHRR